MSHVIFKEEGIVPSTRSIHCRGFLDTSGPRLVAFSCRTVVADVTAGGVTMRVRYEDSVGQIHVAENVPITLGAVEEVNGGYHKTDAFLCIDKCWPEDGGLPFGSGGDEEGRGLFVLEFDLGGPAGTSLISYELSVEVLDNSSNITLVPPPP